LVEFSLVLPLLVILIFGIIDFGMALRSYVSLTNATREGARFAAVGNPLGASLADCVGQQSNSTAVGRVCNTVEGLDLANVTGVSATCQPGGSCAPGNSVVVEADYTYDFITPLGALVSFFSGGAFPGSLGLSTATDMRLE
jgi:Flp pilus assembly protein TadG